MSKLVFLGGTKGGTTKTTTTHLLALGAILRGEPAAYVLTDPRRQLKTEGRPYGVLDGRDPNKLAQIISASHMTQNGWLLIDGGGNRPDFDMEIAKSVDLCLLPFRASEEDLETVSKDLAELPNAIAWPSAWSTNKHAQEAAAWYIEALQKAFPMRVLSEPIYFVNSVSELLGKSLANPSTPVRSAARRAFDLMSECYDERVRPQQIHNQTEAAA